MSKSCFTPGRIRVGFLAAAISAMAIVSTNTGASAAVSINIDKSSQRMTVSVDGVPRHVWRVSTGRAGLETPNGSFRPQRMARTWFSRKYYNSPMPHSIFFHGGFAIHGSNEISRLGGPASHGCVRLHPANAATLYALVQEQGSGSTRISVTGTSPAVVARHASRRGETLRRRATEDDETLAYGRPAYAPAYVTPAYQPYYAPAPAYYAPAYSSPYGWN